jgi:L-fuconate dehydratase
MARLEQLEVHDVRFPTGAQRHGSDAMHPDPDYSAAYVVLRSDDPATLDGHGFAFTIGRGNEVCCAAIRALAPLVRGTEVPSTGHEMGEFARRLTHDSQLRWLGPEKGVTHMAAAAIINAVWDMVGKASGKPVWRLLAEMAPAELVELVDWRYLRDALGPDEARDMLGRAMDGRTARTIELAQRGYPAYTTSPGWIGYDDRALTALAEQAVRDGFGQIKLKVGANLDEDIRRLKAARAAVGPDVRIAIDANQRWDIAEAISWTRALAPFDPCWIEEPTSPDDILGLAEIRRAVAPVRVATGEHVANRVMFKQLLQANAVDVVQIDACRVAGINENVAILLLAAKFGVPVCPHAGGVGLCEVVQHLAFFDFVAVSGAMDDRVIEYVDHLHEHFVYPVTIRGGRYIAPGAPGLSSQLRSEVLTSYAFPNGPAWADPAIPHQIGQSSHE